MGKIKNATIGALNGKVGNLVGASWKGTDYYRIHNEHINDANSPKQIAQRERFKSVSFLIHKLRTAVIKPVWNNRVAHMTGNNAFMAKNMQAINADATIDFSKIVLTAGVLDLPASMNFNKDLSDDGSYVLDWLDVPDAYEFDDSDLLNIVIFNEADVSVTPFLQLRCAARKDMLFQFIPKGDAGNKLHIYAFFSNTDGTDFTESRHFEMTVGD